MSEEIDDNEFFQQDFTTASEWEIFNARLEEQIHEWKLPFVEVAKPLQRHELSLCEWSVTSEVIFFADVELRLTRYSAKVSQNNDDDNNSPTAGSGKSSDQQQQQQPQAFIDLMSGQNNYFIVDERSGGGGGDVHPLAIWYGLRDFVVVAPTNKPITNESQIRIMLSSIHIAVAESSCEIPIFFQALETQQNVFVGVCENRSTRLSFDIVHLRQTPPTCKYLTGLLDMFKGKIGIQYVDPVMVSVRLSYLLSRFGNAAQFTVQRRYAFDDDGDNNDFVLLPFGVSIDPVRELVLHCTWPLIAENVVIDSQNYSDFDPLIATHWSIRGRFESRPICYLSECIGEYLQWHDSRQTLTEVLGSGYSLLGGSFLSEGAEVNPFDQLTESKISKILPTIPLINFAAGGDDGNGDGVAAGDAAAGKKLAKVDGPLHEDQLKEMLYFMFPDADGQSPHAYDVPDVDHVRLLHNAE